MKRLNKSALFLLVSLGSLGFCSEEKKTYVPLDQIVLESSAIFVKIDNLWLETASLHADANGIYVTDLSEDHRWTRWRCPKCGYSNSIIHNRCQNCEKR